MKATKYLLFLTLFAVSCSQHKTQTESEIQQHLDSLTTAWHRAATVADYKNYMAKMDTQSVFVGTAVDEVWGKKEFDKFAAPFFAKGKAWDFEVVERNGYLSENKTVYWFDEVLNTWMGLCRGSGVWEKAKGKWKLKHYVLSVIVPNEDMSAVIVAKKKRDSIYLKKRKIKTKFKMPKK